jgi:hypothetical protein
MDDILKLYNETLSITPPYYNLTTRYPHETAAIGVTFYLMILYYLPLIIPKGGVKIDFLTKAWNLFLSIISIIMFFGITIPLIQKIKTYGLFEVLCDTPKTLYLSEPMVKKTINYRHFLCYYLAGQNILNYLTLLS